jgi:hypothetical protein
MAEEDNILEDVPEVDTVPEDAEEGDEEKARKKKKLLIIIAASVLLLLILLVVLYFFVFSSDEADEMALAYESPGELSEEFQESGLFDDPDNPDQSASEEGNSNSENSDSLALPDVPNEDTDPLFTEEEAAATAAAAVAPTSASAKLAAISGAILSGGTDEEELETEPAADAVPEEDNGPSETDLLKQQIEALRLEFQAMAKTNKELSNNLDEIYNENSMLRATVGLTAAESPEGDATADSPFVNSGYGAYGYEGDPYQFTPKYEIDPKWGEFNENLPTEEQLKSAKKK